MRCTVLRFGPSIDIKVNQHIDGCCRLNSTHKKTRYRAFFYGSEEGLKVLSERNTEVAWSNHTRTVFSPDLVKVITVSEGDAPRISNIVHVDSRAPRVSLQTKDRIGDVIIPLTDFRGREPT